MRPVTGLLVLAFLSPAARAQGPTATDGTRMLDAIQVDSLAVMPIVTTSTKPDKTDLLVLDEAMAKKLVKIKEVDSGEVNELTLTNNGGQPLFLLAGEVVIGGKQDRIIGRNTIIPAKTTQQVPVFCVEHGRWEGKTGEFTTAKVLAHGKLRGKASFESQGAVWDEVHDKNEKRKTTSDSDTYRNVEATLGKAEDKVASAIAKLPAADREKLVGFAVAINGKIETVDVFQSHALFVKLQDKLVKSYVADAIDIAPAKDAKKPTADDVKAFVADAEKAKAEEQYQTKAAHTSMKKGDRADSSKVTIDASPSAPAVYQNVEAK
jgi:hypothetical protein